MRNLEATSYVALLPSTLLADATCFCLDTDAVCVWVVASAGLCRISSDYQVVILPLGFESQDPEMIFSDFRFLLKSRCLMEVT